MTENCGNYFFWNEPYFEEAVKKHVCTHCEYFDEKGVCHTPDSRGCALFRYLPQLVMIAQHLNKLDLNAYSKQVGENVKMECANPDHKTACFLHDTLACDFQKYLPSILKAVEETDEVLEKETRFEGCGVCEHFG